MRSKLGKAWLPEATMSLLLSDVVAYCLRLSNLGLLLVPSLSSYYTLGLSICLSPHVRTSYV